MAKGELTVTLNEGDFYNVMSALDQMGALEREAAVMKALQEGSKIVAKQGKTNLQNSLSTDPHNKKMAAHMAAKRGGKSLLKAVGTKMRKKNLKAYAGFKAGGNHAHLVDSGTRPRWTKKGHYTGSVSKGAPLTGNRFWRRAFEQTKERAQKEIVDSIRITLNRIKQRNS